MEAISGYLILASKLSKNHILHGESFNFGPVSKKSNSVKKVLELFKNYFVYSQYKFKENKKFKEAQLLSLNSSKAIKLLNWKANLTFSETISYVGNWYKNYYSRNKILTKEQILSYQTLAKRRGLSWTRN